MRILICSDLHARPDWYFWLSQVASDFGAVIVAGDLIDMFRSGEKILRDCSLAEAHLDGIERRGTPVFISEGNHDASIAWPWMRLQLGRHQIENLLIQTLPDDRGSDARLDFRISREIANEKKLTWIAVDHYPPFRSRTNSGDDFQLNKQVIDFQPAIIVSGHMHQAPFVPNGSWHDTVNGTLCLNPGCLWNASDPCHIILDSKGRNATWIASGRTETISY
jgi:Icc-related predicted phosphoesterase